MLRVAIDPANPLCRKVLPEFENSLDVDEHQYLNTATEPVAKIGIMDIIQP